MHAVRIEIIPLNTVLQIREHLIYRNQLGRVNII